MEFRMEKPLPKSMTSGSAEVLSWVRKRGVFHMTLSRRGFISFSGSLLPSWRAIAAAAAQSPEPTGSDDTQLLQGAIDRLKPGGILDGAGRQFTVTRLNLRPEMTLRNFKLRAKGTGTPLDAVITIDGNANAAHDIVIQNVSIDGNRSAQTNLRSEEDGGRDGIRIVGKAERLLIADCSAVNCATDGLKIFSHRSLSGNDANLNFRDIYVANSRFLRNRRHGASGDSLRNVHFIDCDFSENGVDLPGSASEGSRGAIDNGVIYGAGVDIEGYGAGSGVDGLYFLRCKAMRNARFGFQFWEPTPPSRPGFLPRKRIVFEGCVIDGGVSPHHAHQALELSQPKANRGGSPTYEDVQVVNLNCSGTVILNGVNRAVFVGGYYSSPYGGFWGIGENSTGIKFLGLDTAGKMFAFHK
jgi:hypothetical protein